MLKKKLLYIKFVLTVQLKVVTKVRIHVWPFSGVYSRPIGTYAHLCYLLQSVIQKGMDSLLLEWILELPLPPMVENTKLDPNLAFLLGGFHL